MYPLIYTRRELLFSLPFSFLLFKGTLKSQVLSEPLREAVYPLDVDLSTGHYAHTQNGFLVFRRGEPFDGKPEVFLYGRDGKLVSRADLSLPDAVRVLVGDVAANQDGLAAATAAIWKGDGTVAHVIFLIELPGQIKRIIRTTPFFAHRICFGPDGALWGFGSNVEAEENRLEHEVFEKYSLEGRLLGKFVPRSSFKCKQRPASNFGDRRTMLVSFLRASKHRIGAYSGPAQQWIELSNDGSLLGRWNAVPPLSLSPSTGSTFYPQRIFLTLVEFTPSGLVYAQLSEGSRHGLFRLDRATEGWVLVSGTLRDLKDPVRLGRFRGTDDEQLVFDDWRDQKRLLWYAAPI